jgi:hypothetical protein
LGGIGQDIAAKFALEDYAEEPTELIGLFFNLLILGSLVAEINELAKSNNLYQSIKIFGVSF